LGFPSGERTVSAQPPGAEPFHPDSRRPQPPSLGALTGVFFRIGNTTFGGGIPTIAALQRELVERTGWLSAEDYGLAFALARITPGTNIIAFCTAVGAQILGLPGALAGALAETAPSALLAVLITQGYESWRSNAIVMAAIGGTVAAVAGMMWASVWSLIKPYVNHRANILRVIVFTGGAFLAISRLDLSPLPIIGIATLLGFLWKDSSPAKENGTK
jgi:chromate transporter